MVGGDVSTKYTRRNEEMYQRYARYLWKLANGKKGNYLVFFPSYRFLEDVYEASPWKLEQIEADLEQESTSYFLAVDEGQVLGFVAIQETLYEAEVLQIAVKPAFQGQGLAQQLLAQLPDQKEIFLEVRVSNQPAQGLYKKMHFEEIARRKNYYHDPIEDAVIMKRNPNER